MTNNDERKAPVLRFKGFTDDWEQRKLGEIAILSDLDHKMPKTQLKGIPYIMTNNFIQNGGIDFKNSKKISINDYKILSLKSSPQIGDTILARYASVGATRYVSYPFRFLVSYSCTTIHPKDNFNGRFLFFSFNTPYIKYQISINTKTGSQSNIGMNDLKKFIKIKFPNIEEQKKIENILFKVQNLIALQQRKLEQLKLIKQFLLQNLFTKNQYPTLRFKGCNESWEQRKLGVITKRIKSYSISHGFETNEKTNTKYIHYGDIHTGKVKVINNINLLPNINDNNYISLKKGDVIVADASEDYKGIADASILNIDPLSDKVVAGLHTIALRPLKTTYPKYLYMYLFTDIFKHYGYRTGTGLKVFGISYNELAKFVLSQPKIDEQKQIVKIISLVNNLISLQQVKLTKLKEQKKFLLQNMFI